LASPVLYQLRRAGVGESLKWQRIAEVLDRHRGKVRLFLRVVDRDSRSTWSLEVN